MTVRQMTPRPAPPLQERPVADPHADASELLRRLADAARRGDRLDLFLLSCGLSQVIADCAEGASSPLRRAFVHLGGGSGALPVRALGRVLDLRGAVVAMTPAGRALRARLAMTTDAADRLAETLITTWPGGRDGGSPRGLDEPLRELLSQACRPFPRGAARMLRGHLLRPPSCFRSFDQHPADVAALAARFTVRFPDRDRPLLVLGLRTSGSYLAPLAGAALRRSGHRRVMVRTTRPDGRLLAGEAGLLRRIRRGDGLVLLIDDPPTSGGSLATVARTVGRAGFPADRVVPLFAVFGGAGRPAPVGDHPCVILPGSDWDIRGRLQGDRLLGTVRELLGDRHVIGVDAPAPGPPSRWSHLAVPVDVLVADDQGGHALPMVAEGAGLGFLGRQAVAVAESLAGLVPRVYGFADGLVLRERLPGESWNLSTRAGKGNEPAGNAGNGDGNAPATTESPPQGGGGVPAEAIAGYVAARRWALRLPADRAGMMGGRQPVWEIGARLLARGLGRWGLVFRPFLVDPSLRALTRSGRPCVVDGQALPHLWHAGGDGGWVKTDFDEGCFGHLDLAGYDPVYDLAGAATFDPALDDGVITAYERETGDRVSPAAWCVYKLVHAWNAERLIRAGADTSRTGIDTRRAQARAVQDFLGRHYLGDLADPGAEPGGPWCVLDIDGVLENDMFGFPAPSPASMRALRALRAHGYRVLLATGRPLPDVRDRCAAFRLDGGVAEYGAVLYDARSGGSSSLLPRDGGDLRSRLTQMTSVTVDPQYRWCVRAWRGDGRGRRPLDDRQVAGVLAEPAFEGRFTAVTGDAQTDFLPRGLDKADGVSALVRMLDGSAAAVALAVGDTAADIGFLRSADLGFAPGHADGRTMRGAGVPVLRRYYQAGLAEAVGRLLGHPPGVCPVCRPPRPEPAEHVLLSLLALPEAGRRGALPRLVTLAWAQARVRAEDRARHPESRSGRARTARESEAGR